MKRKATEEMNSIGDVLDDLMLGLKLERALQSASASQKGPGTEAPGQFREERQTVAEKSVCKIQQLPNDRPVPAALTVVVRNKCVANPTRLPREAAHLFLITVNGLRTDH